MVIETSNKTPRVKFIPLGSEQAQHFRNAGLDANGQIPQEQISDGGGNPCRNCFRDIPKGEGMLVFALRPFVQAQPYAETGPVFLCKQQCSPYKADEQKSDRADFKLPEIFETRKEFLIRGYCKDNIIVEGSGRIVSKAALTQELMSSLTTTKIAYMHIRSATNNCFQCRVELG